MPSLLDPATINNNNYLLLQNLANGTHKCFLNCDNPAHPSCSSCANIENSIDAQNKSLDTQISTMKNDGSVNKQKYQYQTADVKKMSVVSYFLFILYYFLFVLFVVFIVNKNGFIAGIRGNAFTLLLALFFPFYIGILEQIVFFLYKYITALLNPNVYVSAYW